MGRNKSAECKNRGIRGGGSKKWPRLVYRCDDELDAEGTRGRFFLLARRQFPDGVIPGWRECRSYGKRLQAASHASQQVHETEDQTGAGRRLGSEDKPLNLAWRIVHFA